MRLAAMARARCKAVLHGPRLSSRGSAGSTRAAAPLPVAHVHNPIADPTCSVVMEEKMSSSACLHRRSQFSSYRSLRGSGEGRPQGMHASQQVGVHQRSCSMQQTARRALHTAGRSIASQRCCAHSGASGPRSSSTSCWPAPPAPCCCPSSCSSSSCQGHHKTQACVAGPREAKPSQAQLQGCSPYTAWQSILAINPDKRS